MLFLKIVNHSIFSVRFRAIKSINQNQIVVGINDGETRFINIRQVLGLCLMVLILLNCQSEYEQYVERELASKVLSDSLIFGMRMGQTKKDFFTICWELNSQKLISQGTGNSTARFNYRP